MSNRYSGNCALGHEYRFSGPRWWCEWRDRRWWDRHLGCQGVSS